MTHFKGAFFETRFLTISDYFNTAEHMSYSYLTHVPLKKVRSTDNQEVFSDQKMILFKKWFEREILLTNSIIYLPDFGGSYIEGAKILKIDEIKLKNNSKKIFHENIKNINNMTKRINSAEITDKINNFTKKALKIKDLCNKIIKLIPDSAVLSDNNMNEVNKLEKQLMNNPEYKEVADIISSSAQNVLLSIMENISLDMDQKKSGWKKTKLIYQSIYELTDFFTNSFKKLLKQNY